MSKAAAPRATAPLHIVDITTLDAATVFASELVGAAGEMLWWRGQAREDWDILPSAHRLFASGKQERSVVSRFMQKAGSRSVHVPGLTEFHSWLFLMQHYGLPTRLLDWSESVLVAVYFAVEGTLHDGYHGSLTALNPFALNRLELQHAVVVTPLSSEVRPLFATVFDEDEPGAVMPNAVAIAPNQFDPRMMAQQTAFTIHSSRSPLNESERHPEFLVRFRIPANAKPGIRTALNRLGIHRSGLFPDLQNLAADLVSQEGV